MERKIFLYSVKRKGSMREAKTAEREVSQKGKARRKGGLADRETSFP